MAEYIVWVWLGIFLITLTVEIFTVEFVSVWFAVAAIPEGLPTVVTIMLSIGITKMARKNSIVKNNAVIFDVLKILNFVSHRNIGSDINIRMNFIAPGNFFCNIRNFFNTRRSICHTVKRNPFSVIQSF